MGTNVGAMDAVMAAIDASIERQVGVDNRAVLGDQDEALRIVRDVVASRKLMIHGGMALNAVLPASRKFYDSSTIPDYDVMISDDTGKETKRLMYDVQRRVTAAGYWSVFKPAIHDSTQKLRAHPKGITRLAALRYPTVLDVTAVRAEDFARMRELAEGERAARAGDMKTSLLVPIAFMKMSLHLEFSRPSVHIRRWSKLFPRAALLYATYPTVVVAPAQSDRRRGARRGRRGAGKPRERAEPGQAGGEAWSGREVLQRALEVVGDNVAFAVGEVAALEIMGRASDAGARVGLVVRDMTQAHDAFTRAGVEAGDVVAESTFLPEHFRVGRAVTVYAWEECTAVVAGGRLGNADALLRYMYGEYLKYGDASLIDALVAFLGELPVGRISDDGDLARRFGTECK